MTPVWLKAYHERSGELIDVNNLKDWNFENFVKYPDLFHEILREDNFFFNLDPLPGVIENLQRLMDEDYDVVFLTQLPRKSDFAAKDKRSWIKKYFPKFDLENVIFAHRKLLVHGDILFDDNPHHLLDWNKKWTNNWESQHLASTLAPLTVTIDYLYNQNVIANWRFMDKDTAWKEFYVKVSDHYRSST